jgi:WD40 repeat protein
MVRAWAIDGSMCVKALGGNKENITVRCFVLQPNAIISTASDGTILELDADTYNIRRSISGHNQWVTGYVNSLGVAAVCAPAH